MYGRTFARTFPFAYTRKYWTVEPAAMDVDWVGVRMYPPTLAEVVRGALAPDQEGDFHYLSTFRYPSRGGYQSFMGSMHRPELLRTGKAVVGLDPRKGKLEFADGSSARFERLISTMPLPELVRVIRPDQVPADVRAAAERLLCSSLELVDVAVSRRDLFDHHWFYVYDEDVCFARGHFPHMLSPHNAPEGAGAIQLEVYHSRHRPLAWPRESLSDRVVEDLLRLGILRDRAEVLWVRQRSVPYANVVFDRQRAAALPVVRSWVEAQGIVLAGRYGEWGYHWTDDATVSGWRAAERVLGR
jgi:protoporphyrinogen oxidase